MRISIFAAIWCQNLWDELILKNEIEHFEKKYKKEGHEVEFRVCTYDMKRPFFTKENVTYVEYFPIGSREGNRKRNLKNYITFLKTVFWSDLIIIWGGGLFYDSELQKWDRTLDLRLFRTKHFRFFHKKYNFYAISIDVKKEKNLKKIYKIFKGANKTYVRDEHSRKLLFEMKLNAHEIDDPVFFDNPEYSPKHRSLIKVLNSKNFSLKDFKDIDIEGKRIGIAFRPGYLSLSNNQDIEVAKIWELIHFLIGNGARKLVFLPHSIHPHDQQANDYHFLKQFLSPKVDVLDSIGDVYDAYKFKKIDLCFAMRLHSIILSEVYHIPYIALSYSQKTDEVIKKITHM